MPDISMCQDKECPSRMRCYRFTAKPSNTQYYAKFERHGYRCDNFIEAISKSQVRRLDCQTNRPKPK